ncbi:MAG: outer membrane protein assembly factor BamB [Planctomycetota bacterium]|jgi:outer membrane protein assembly factor BamB
MNTTLLGLISLGSLAGIGGSYVQDGAAKEASSAEDFQWSQWNGPQFDGVSTESEWKSEGKPLWETEVGLGYSTVSVVDGRAVTMGYDKELGLDVVFCFDALTGEELWSHAYPSKIWDLAHEGGTVNTPSFDDDLVLSLNREGNLFALDVESGEIIWHNELKPEENPHKLEYPRWGFSASPMVLDDGVYLNCGRLLSIDRDSGEVLWASEDFGHGYGTPLALEVDGVPALAVQNNDRFGVVDRRTGKTLASLPFGGKNRGINASTPVMMDAGVFIASGTLPGCAMLKLGEKEPETLWQNRSMVTSFSGCVAMDDYLYGFDGAVLTCIDSAGESSWSERGIGNGAVSGAGDRLLVMGGTGELIVIKASSEGFEELSRVELFEEGKFWTKPVLVNGIVYCRSSRGTLMARDHRE